MPDTLEGRLAKIAVKSLIRHAIVGFLSAGTLSGACVLLDAMDIADAHDAFDAVDAVNTCSTSDIDTSDLNSGDSGTSHSGHNISFTGNISPGDPISGYRWDLDHSKYYPDWDSYVRHDGTGGFTLDELKANGVVH